ncbi:MAG: NAD-dependent epimerase/dehydratase [Acidobacteriota bacterium]
MEQSTYLVTGAHGFIGAWVIKRLLAEDARIVVFDRNPDPQRLRMILDAHELAELQFVAGDICELDPLCRLIADYQVTHIIHLAGLQVPTCRADPRLGAMVNVIGTINVFEAARLNPGQISQIAYASSAAVFGEPERAEGAASPRAVKEGEATDPTSHYGAFKRCNEDNARVFFMDNGLRSIGLRPLTVYGVGRDFGVTSDPTKAMKAAVVGRPFHIRFGGKTDFLYASDAADAFIRATRSTLDGAHVFNLHGQTAAISSIVEEIERVRPTAKGTITHASNSLPIPEELSDAAIRSALGDLPSTPLRIGIKETIERFELLHREGRLDTSDLDV